MSPPPLIPYKAPLTLIIRCPRLALTIRLYSVGVTNAVYYGFYSWSSDKARLANAGQLTVRQSILAGLVAGTATTVRTLTPSLLIISVVSS